MTGQNGKSRVYPPGDGSRLGAFVSDLEKLRRAAGQPSLRKMSEAGHYSHTALSSVLSGTRLPSRELTLAFVRACGGDEGAWRERWEREYAILHADDPGPGRPARRLHPPRWAIAAAAVATTFLAGAGAFALWRDDPVAAPSAAQTTAGTPGPPAVGDGADPQEHRCHLDAMNAETVEVPGRHATRPRYGSLTLRYSPRCGAAWPLFISNERVPTGATVRLTATRPSDGAVSRFDYPFLVRRQVYSVFGNVLLTDEGCVSVAVEIQDSASRGALARADTSCVRLSAGG